MPEPENASELTDGDKERLRRAARDRLIDDYDVDTDEVDVDDGCAVVLAGERGAAWAQVWVYVPAGELTDGGPEESADDP